MANEKYYKLEFQVDSEWEYFYFKTKGELKMTDTSSYKIKSSKLEEISEEEYKEKLKDHFHDYSRGH